MIKSIKFYTYKLWFSKFTFIIKKTFKLFVKHMYYPPKKIMSCHAYTTKKIWNCSYKKMNELACCVTCYLYFKDKTWHANFVKHYILIWKLKMVWERHKDWVWATNVIHGLNLLSHLLIYTIATTLFIF